MSLKEWIRFDWFTEVPAQKTYQNHWIQVDNQGASFKFVANHRLIPTPRIWLTRRNLRHSSWLFKTQIHLQARTFHLILPLKNLMGRNSQQSCKTQTWFTFHHINNYDYESSPLAHLSRLFSLFFLALLSFPEHKSQTIFTTSKQPLQKP
jgi:hypothetical protein